MDAEAYRRKAEQYLTFAHQMREPNAKAALIDVAAHWMQMASRASACLSINKTSNRISLTASEALRVPAEP
jgi:hypothetical protein